MSKPLVSIVTPSYNQAGYISETVESVKMQTYENIEHIIVDGGSNDNTQEILSEYDENPSIRWVSESDDGQADAIRKGFAMSEGKILAWINSDDLYVARDAVETIVNIFDSYPNVDVVSGDGMRLGQNGEYRKVLHKPRRYANKTYLEKSDTLLQPATFWHYEVWDKVNINPSYRYVFDWDLFAQMARRANILSISKVIAGYRIHEGSKTVSGRAERIREIRELTGKNLGQSSWQYGLISLYYFGMIGANYLGEDISESFYKFMRKISLIVQYTLDRRVMSI
ncbi:glycosyltransferase family 2 protein [Natrinema sp. H-ect4]|uniref:glycosyltransferase family 2 protein n=1 Tax=Natrinema sp. H-ect4 TaxID=3242699 RepID=UPI0035A920D9